MEALNINMAFFFSFLRDVGPPLFLFAQLMIYLIWLCLAWKRKAGVGVMGGLFDMSSNGYLHLDSWGESNNTNWTLYFSRCLIPNHNNTKSAKP